MFSWNLASFVSYLVICFALLAGSLLSVLLFGARVEGAEWLSLVAIWISALSLMISLHTLFSICNRRH